MEQGTGSPEAIDGLISSSRSHGINPFIFIFFYFPAEKEHVVMATAVDVKKALVAGVAAVAMAVATPSADAGVVLVQPTVKNFVKDSPSAAAPSSSGEKKATTKRAPPPASTSEGFDFKPLVLPLSLVSVVAGGFALANIDPGFAELMEEAGAKDSRGYAGYETGLKDTPFYGGNGSIPTSVSGGKAPAKKAAKKGGLFGR